MLSVLFRQNSTSVSSDPWMTVQETVRNTDDTDRWVGVTCSWEAQWREVTELREIKPKTWQKEEYLPYCYCCYYLVKVGGFLLPETQTTPGDQSTPGTNVALPLHQTDAPPTRENTKDYLTWHMPHINQPTHYLHYLFYLRGKHGLHYLPERDRLSDLTYQL